MWSWTGISTENLAGRIREEVQKPDSKPYLIASSQLSRREQTLISKYVHHHPPTNNESPPPRNKKRAPRPTVCPNTQPGPRLCRSKSPRKPPPTPNSGHPLRQSRLHLPHSHDPRRTSHRPNCRYRPRHNMSIRRAAGPPRAVHPRPRRR